MKKSHLINFLILACLIVLPVSSFAIPISGAGQWGSFTGDLNYSTNGTLTVNIRNTSPEANGGYIVGFVFNNPGNITLVNYEYSAPEGSSFFISSTNNGINGQPYGYFDILASTSTSFEGGGAPQAGIPVNSYANFTFLFSGPNLAALTAESFLNTYSTTGEASFVVRFRGFENDASDKVPYSVPEPMTVLMLGIGLLGMGIATRRKS
jgi:hypothetical protein